MKKPDWRKLSWKAARPLLVKLIQSVFKKFIGPLGWVSITVINQVIDKYGRPLWLKVTRKVDKKKNESNGREQSGRVRDAEDVDDIYDNMRK